MTDTALWLVILVLSGVLFALCIQVDSLADRLNGWPADARHAKALHQTRVLMVNWRVKEDA